MGNHPDLSDRALCFRDFVGHRNLMYDNNGHGTHVCGILCGSGHLSAGRYRGMAPGARLVVGKVLDEKGEGSTETMLEGIEWVLEIKRRYGVRILNISVGIGNLREPAKEQLLQDKNSSCRKKLMNCGAAVCWLYALQATRGRETAPSLPWEEAVW